MLTPTTLLGFVAAAHAAATIDAAHFATTGEIRHLADKICGTEPRLPGSEQHLKVVDFIKCQLEGIPGLEMEYDEFKLAAWEPTGNSLYQAARLKIDDQKIDVVGAMAYSLPTNGSYVTAPLIYLNSTANISTTDVRGKIIIRDFVIPPVPTELITGIAYHASADATEEATYARPYLSPVQVDLLAASFGGAAGFISAINASRDQMEGYYTHHSGTHWLVPGVFIGADAYSTLLEAAAKNGTASIRVDAQYSTKRVPRFWATLPGQSNETIVLATHTDGVTYVQENGPVALLTLARYFASMPLSARKKTIRFDFEASHLAYQLDSDKLLAKSLDATYDNANDTTAFVIAIEHLGSREILPMANSSTNELAYTGKSEALLWSVGPSQHAIDSVVNIAESRNLNNTVVAPGFPPGNDDAVPKYFSMGGLGSYYHSALLPTAALITGPWSLWAPNFGADALDYDLLRVQHMAIGDAVLALSEYSKAELAGNYTQYRERRAMGAMTNMINYETDQFITSPDNVYY